MHCLGLHDISGVYVYLCSITN